MPYPPRHVLRGLKRVWQQGRAEAWPLFGFAAVCLLGLVFLDFAEDLHEGEVFIFDKALLLWLRGGSQAGEPIGPSWLPNVAIDFTSLGSTSVLTLITVASFGFLLIEKNWRSALLVLIAVCGGALLTTLFKDFMERPRPDVVLHLVKVTNPSFPSGHAANSAATYLTLGALLARVNEGRRAKAFIVSLAIFVTFLVGATRIYLGVHWPSDVIAGWCLGSAWAILCWLAAIWLARRCAVESKLL